ncbi:MAG: manganese efflux pump [Spirochaetes bacterium]|nr:manganese efflux pump [Spirochaetota bacterium]
MDAFAVSIASGVTIKELRLEHALRIALFFGGFQAFMPLLGWLAGGTLSDATATVDHWIIFGILLFIGGKMIYESVRIKENERRIDCTKVSVLLFLSLATSIDALAAGFSFAFLDLGIVRPVLVIGGVTFCLSLAGVYIGDRIGHLFESKIEIVGGIVLIGVGIKILVEHLLCG